MTFRAAFYKGTRPGLPGIYNRTVRWGRQSPHSHAELIFSDGVAASASYMDGGVRFKEIDFNPDHWDFVELPAHLEPAARQWFIEHEGEEYDLMGNAFFILSIFTQSDGKLFCSEAIAAALGFDEPWRFDPAILFVTVSRSKRPAQSLTLEGML